MSEFGFNQSVRELAMSSKDLNKETDKGEEEIKQQLKDFFLRSSWKKPSEISRAADYWEFSDLVKLCHDFPHFEQWVLTSFDSHLHDAMYRYRDLVVEHFPDPASELPPSSREQIRMGVKDTFYKLYPDLLRYAKGENHDKLSFPYFVKLCFNPDQFAGFKNDAQMPPELQNNVDRLREHATRYFRSDEFG